MSIFSCCHISFTINTMKVQQRKDTKANANTKFTRNRGSKESIPLSSGKIKKKIRDTQRMIGKVTQDMDENLHEN